MIGLLLLAAGAASTVTPPAQPGYPKEDVLFDCQLREAADAGLVPDSWSARSDSVERFGWLLSRSESVLKAADDSPRLRYSGPWSIFATDGLLRTVIDWPGTVEFDTARLTGREAQQWDKFIVLEIDLAKHSARVAVIQSEWRHGSGVEDAFVTGGYFGDCDLVEGEAAVRQFEEIE